MPQSVLALVTGEYSAVNYNFPPTRLIIGAPTTGAQTVTPATGQQCLLDGTAFNPFATTAPLLFDIGSNAETVTPSAVTGASTYSPGGCTITATFSNTHGQGCLVQSGTAGLQEAINAAKAAGGGVVNVDQTWAAAGGTTAMLAAAVNGTNVTIVDLRTGSQTWSFNGTTFAIAPQGLPTILYAANGAISVAPQYAILTKAGVDAMTLAAPTAAQNGMTIIITSRTANAHTLTATGLLNTGSASVNVATFAAFAGAGLTLVADNLKYNVVSQIGITFS
jgi:hypothetical protein